MKCTQTSATILMLILFPLLLLSACSKDDPAAPTNPVDNDPIDENPIEEDLVISDWTEITHGNSADPDYDEVFAEDTVKRLDIEISAENWQAMLDDMTETYGPFGTGGGLPADDEDNPIWVPGSVFYEGTQWYKVGVRFKGNSSLRTSWGRGVMKLPLKLDFDEFEDTYPQIDNQRFHGFKQLALSSSYDDQSLIREKVVADIFREAGLCSARTAFYRVYIDFGEEPVYFGLYTMVEIVDDTAVDDQFDDNDGNLYKPEGIGAGFAYGTFDQQWFSKESNEDAADWSDILSLFDTLHASTRTSNPALWRSGLESVLDVDVFLNWLAVNTVIQNWDTYGRMTHNYYLYNDPQTGLLNWIPWDNNEALQDGKQGGAVSLDFRDVDARWPLIRYLYDDDVYLARYVARVQAAIDGPFSPARMVPIYQAAGDLIEPYVVGPEGELDGYTFLESDGDFPAAISALIQHVNQRNTLAEFFIDQQQ
jgi:spore coat protein H